MITKRKKLEGRVIREKMREKETSEIKQDLKGRMCGRRKIQNNRYRTNRNRRAKRREMAGGEGKERKKEKAE